MTPLACTQMLSGSLGIQNGSQHIGALHSVALRFPGFGGVSQENRATPPKRGVAPRFFWAIWLGVGMDIMSQL